MSGQQDADPAKREKAYCEIYLAEIANKINHVVRHERMR
jgi:hypothetical protein